jgi:hypothetical protein
VNENLFDTKPVYMDRMSRWQIIDTKTSSHATASTTEYDSEMGQENFDNVGGRNFITNDSLTSD